MSHTVLILTAIVTMALLLFISPSVLAFNRGRILRNIALWLLIFLGLAVFYKNFGPESPHPLFSLPEAMRDMHQEQTAPTPEPQKDNSGKKDTEIGI